MDRIEFEYGDLWVVANFNNWFEEFGRIYVNDMHLDIYDADLNKVRIPEDEYSNLENDAVTYFADQLELDQTSY